MKGGKGKIFKEGLNYVVYLRQTQMPGISIEFIQSQTGVRLRVKDTTLGVHIGACALTQTSEKLRRIRQSEMENRTGHIIRKKELRPRGGKCQVEPLPPLPG